MNTAKQAKLYREDGKYLLALRCAQLGSDPESKAEESLALCWLGRIQQAEKCASEAWNMCRTNTAPDIRVRVLLSLINSQLSMGKYDESETLIEQVQRELPAPSDAELRCRILLAKSALAAQKGDFHPSIQYAKEGAIAIRRGRERVLAEAMHALADACHRSGHLEQAVVHWRAALALRKKNLRTQHPEIATNIDGMALTCRRLNMPELAIALHTEALGIYRQTFDETHPARAACHHGLSQCYSRLEKPHLAIFHIEKALLFSENRLGKDHIDTWVTRFELGRMEIASGKTERGFTRMEHAYARAKQILGAKHPTVLSMDKWRKD
ncbi:MAG: tetratricopeptide repeat protein [Myxococcota bacterium]|nr:tetratricopeptide repeat protein [Myxococcota bacterium]